MNFSIVIPVYNEEKRIIPLLNSIQGYSNNIVVINKSSTDNTKQIILENFPNVQVVDFLYSERGIDDFKAYCNHCAYDWVFICVASEIVPSIFWKHFNSVINESILDKYDLVMIPRLYFCFGENVKNSPWDISYFPFFFNKKKVLFSKVLHSHFNIDNEFRRYYFHCDRTEMIKHVTHSSFESYLNNTLNYADIEIKNISDTDVSRSLKLFVENIYEGQIKLANSKGMSALEHFAAWNLYWSICILKLCKEKKGKKISSNAKKFLKISFFKKLMIYLKPKLMFLTIKSVLFRISIYKIKKHLSNK